MIVAIVVAVLFGLAVLAMARFAWRIARGHEEPEAGGSLGRQFLPRRNDDPPG